MGNGDYNDVQKGDLQIKEAGLPVCDAFRKHHAKTKHKKVHA